MPELPEVETVMRGLEPAMLNQVIQKVSLHRQSLRVPIPANFKETVEGSKVIKMIRRGKYIVAHMNNDHSFVLHLGMSGRILIDHEGKDEKPGKHDHVVFHIKSKTNVIFNDPRRFGMLILVPTASWESDKVFAKMGPEPLGNHFNAPYLKDRLKGMKSSIKAALLDQHVVSGVGNIYACEALFEAGIHPEREAGSISAARIEKLVPAVRQVLNKAIKAGGSSLRDYRQTDGTLGYFQHHFSVYDCEGKPCPHCGTHIKRIVQSGRSTFFCPKEQK
mgnify:CR=1 FL=1